MDHILISADVPEGTKSPIKTTACFRERSVCRPGSEIF